MCETFNVKNTHKYKQEMNRHGSFGDFYVGFIVVGVYVVVPSLWNNEQDALSFFLGGQGEVSKRTENRAFRIADRVRFLKEQLRADVVILPKHIISSNEK